MALRDTQTGVEFLVLPDGADIRITQFGVEFLVGPVVPNLRVTHAGVEFLIARPVGGSCGDGWTIPTPDYFPTPNYGGPLYTRFQETEGDWATYSERFPDGTKHANTLAAEKIRIFEIDYDGLPTEWGEILDNHYNSTRSRIPFTIELPQTLEVVEDVRYDEYERPPHVRKWASSRRIRLIKFPS